MPKARAPPELGATRPSRSWRAVDLPEPVLPTKAITAPAGTARSISCRDSVSLAVPRRYAWLAPRRAKTGAGGGRRRRRRAWAQRAGAAELEGGRDAPGDRLGRFADRRLEAEGERECDAIGQPQGGDRAHRASGGGKQIFGSAVEDDRAGVEHQYPRGARSLGHVVGDMHDRLSRRDETVQKSEHGLARLGVEHGRRLVEGDAAHVHRQDSGDGEPLLLSRPRGNGRASSFAREAPRQPRRRRLGRRSRAWANRGSRARKPRPPLRTTI